MSGLILDFFDLSSVYYSSYYLHGFHELKYTRGLKLLVHNQLPPRLAAAVKDRTWQHLLFGMALFRLRRGDREYFFCIDTHDSNTLNVVGRPDGYHLPLLESVDAWFKVNFNPDLIDNTPALRAHRGKIHGTAQFFPLRPPMRLALSRRILLPPALFGIYPGLAHDTPYAGALADTRRRLRELRKFAPLDEIIAHRHTPRDIDVFFVASFYGKPRHEASMQNRYQILKRLLATHDLNIVAGFASFGHLPDRYADLSHPRLSRETYIRTLARSRVVIYTRGMESCISSKFSLAMALGVAALGEPIINNPKLFERNTHLGEQFAWTDPDEIADRAIELATQPDKASQLGALNAAMFDSQIAPRAAAQEILDTLHDFL